MSGKTHYLGGHWLQGNIEPAIRVQLDDGAKLPKRAHPTDAGADILTPRSFVLAGRGTAVIRTGVHVELPSSTVGIVASKSGLYVGKPDGDIFVGGCIMTTGVVDEGYAGEIVVRLTNLGRYPHAFKRGDKIAQLLVMPVLYPGFAQVDAISGGERGDSGFGSSGR